MKFAVIDDDKEFLKYFKSITKDYSENHVFDFYDSPLDFFDLIRERKASYDVLFLDIDMPKINGIYLADKIYKEINKDIIIIFVTNKKELVYDAFGLNVLYFIYKPDLVSQITKVMEKIYLVMSAKEKFVVSFSHGKELFKIDDIVYIEKINRKIYLYSKDEDLICTNYRQLLELNDLLKYSNFVYINRSVILNLIHATKIKDGYIYLYNGQKFDISRRRVNEITEAFIQANTKALL